MNTSIYTISAVLLIMFSLAPLARAEVIVNRVESYVHTGGQSVDGQDGRNGTDGADGEDAGTSGTASVRIESYVNGEKVIDVDEEETVDDARIRVHETYVSEPEAVVDVDAAASSDTPVRTDTAGLLALLSSIRVTLLAYVSNLF